MDMLTRWKVWPKSSLKTSVGGSGNALVQAPVDLSRNEGFDWPTRSEIISTQVRCKASASSGFILNEKVLLKSKGFGWIPNEESLWKLRLLYAAHIRRKGHRYSKSTFSALASHFWQKSMQMNCKEFKTSCLNFLCS